MDRAILKLRKLGPNDAVVAQKLVERFHDSAASEAYLSRLLSDQANLLFVAEGETQVVGFVWAHWLARLRMDRQHLFVYEVEVAGDHRRQGIGTKLMQAVLAEASSEGADVFLFTNHSNEAAVAFYTALGGRVKYGDDLLIVYPADRAT